MNQTTVSVNVGQAVHITTRDKIELALRKTLPGYAGLESVLAPLSLLITIVLTSVTADYQDELGVGADGWRMLFLLAGLASTAWLLRGIWRYTRRVRLQGMVDAIIREADREP